MEGGVSGVERKEKAVAEGGERERKVRADGVSLEWEGEKDTERERIKERNKARKK